MKKSVVLTEIRKASKSIELPVNYQLMDGVNDKTFVRISHSDYYNCKSMYCQVFYKPISQLIKK